ncbi:hypothetical protein [Nonomuraea sp. NPDC050643]|uniref:hypothetical protein n=1 Tax=Nonomuraea sp. NPDC050643 TaxID=3155660 RepID=UPI0033E7968C
MRAKDIPDRLWSAVRKHFPGDVAEAIIGDHEDARAAAARCASYAADTPEDLDAAVKAIAAIVNDRTADWLVDDAEAPAAWLASQLRSY